MRQVRACTVSTLGAAERHLEPKAGFLRRGYTRKKPVFLTIKMKTSQRSRSDFSTGGCNGIISLHVTFVKEKCAASLREAVSEWTSTDSHRESVGFEMRQRAMK